MCEQINRVRSFRRAGLAAAVALMAASMAEVVQAEDNGANAALRYWQVWAQLDPSLIKAIDAGPTEGIDQPDWTAPAALVKAVADENVMGALERAAYMDHADFGAEVDRFPETILAHLSLLHRSIRLLMIRARLATDAGEHAKTARALAAGYRVAHHSLMDGLLITSANGVAYFNGIDMVVRYAIGRGALDAEDRALLRDALSKYPDDDPFLTESAIVKESGLIVRWLSQAWGSGDRALDAQRVVARLRELAREDADLSGVEAALAEREDLETELTLFELLNKQAVAVWNQPDAPVALAGFEKSASEGAFGLVAKAYSPPFVVLHERDTLGRRLIREARARLAP